MKKIRILKLNEKGDYIGFEERDVRLGRVELNGNAVQVYEGDYILSNNGKESLLSGGLSEAQEKVNALSSFDRGFINDTHHSFNELYEFRKMYNAVLFNEWAYEYMIYKDDIERGWKFLQGVAPKYNVHKSWKHNDGEWCFGEEKRWFIVSAMLPTGLISNHYKAKDWDLFKVPVVDKALYEYDGHTGEDVLERLKNLI